LLHESLTDIVIIHIYTTWEATRTRNTGGVATRARARAVREAVEGAEALARALALGLAVQLGGLRQRRAPAMAQLQGEQRGSGKLQRQA
jgi:hypothetical protein